MWFYDMSEKNEMAIRGRGKHVQEATRYHTLAIEIAVAVIAPTLGGYWLDARTGKEPWFTIAGLILGAAAAARSIQRTYNESQRALESGRDSRDSAEMEPSE